jgi:hypothetical protein
MASSNDPITYGNWKRLDSPGILGLGKLGTALLAVDLIISVFISMQNFLFAIIWFLITGGLLFLIVRKNKHNMSILYQLILHFQFMRQKMAHRGIYRSGPLSHIPNGSYRLPSIAANTTLMKYFDPQGREVGILVHNNRYITFVLQSEPEGAQLLDQETINQQVSRYGSFLNNLNNEPGLESVSVTVETEPENGLKLRKEVNAHLSENASDFAKATMAEIVENYPAGSASINVYTALTYSLQKLQADKRPIEDIILDIVQRIPLLASSLEASGAGVCRAMNCWQLYREIRTAYDPDSSSLFEEADLEEEQLVDWNNVGPSIAVNKWDYYVTDSGVHKTWIMSQPPRGLVMSSVLTRLLDPNPNFKRKRVTLIYKPMQFEESSRKVEDDLTNAQFKANNEKRATARQQIAVQQAAQSAAEEARGATLIRFGMVVTVTIDSTEQLNQTDAIMTNLSAGSHIVLRSANGTQDSAFIAGLPLGLILDNFYSGFDNIKDML